MSSKSQPTILLAHGSWHTPTIYSSFLNSFSAKGYKAYCPHLPTSSPKYLVADPSNPSFNQPPPTAGAATPADDAEVLKAELKKIIEGQGEEVIIIAHSSGGWAASEAAVTEFHRSNRRARNLSGGIIGLFYITAFIVKKGESILDSFKNTVLPTPSPAQEDQKEAEQWFTCITPDLTIPQNSGYFFFHDVPAHMDVKTLEAQLTAGPHMTSQLTHSPYAALPVGYLFCEHDRVLSIGVQEGMIRVAEENMTQGVRVWRGEGGHEAFLSRGDEVVRVVEEFVRGCE